MNKINKIAVDHNHKLQLHVYVAGYYPMGESILIIVYETGKRVVHKSILIDCYEQNSINRLKPILDSYGISSADNTHSLDYIVWTHPDQDHSTGFDSIISNYTSTTTTCLLPLALQLDDCKSAAAKDAMNFISRLSTGRNYRVHPVGVVSIASYPLVLEKNKFIDLYTDDLDFEMEILTPSSNHIFRKKLCCDNFCLNDYSISIIIRFGKLNFYFGGDSENCSINMIDSEKFKGIDFVKIPHHASKTSDCIIKKIGENYNSTRLITSVSTSFVHGSAKLPDVAVLNEYKKYSDNVYLTDNSASRSNNFGIWKFVYNIQQQQLYKPEPLGDAQSI